MLDAKSGALPQWNIRTSFMGAVKSFALLAGGFVVRLCLMIAKLADAMKEMRTYHGDAVADPPPRFDRRSRDRIALRIPLRVLSYGPLAEKSSDAVCTDLSEGGVAFETAAELTVGDIVILEFQLKGETAYRCHVRLTYRMERRYGGYFLAGH